MFNSELIINAYNLDATALTVMLTCVAVAAAAGIFFTLRKKRK